VWSRNLENEEAKSPLRGCEKYNQRVVTPRKETGMELASLHPSGSKNLENLCHLV